MNTAITITAKIANETTGAARFKNQSLDLPAALAFAQRAFAAAAILARAAGDILRLPFVFAAGALSLFPLRTIAQRARAAAAIRARPAALICRPPDFGGNG